MVAAAFPHAAQATEISSPSSSLSSEADAPAFTFTSAEGTRTFDVVGADLIPHVLTGDTVIVEGKAVNVYNSGGQLVASVEAETSAGVAIVQADGKVSLVSTGGTSRSTAGCIDNKWGGWVIGGAFGALVCTPLGLGTGGVAAVPCAIATSTAITALSC
ncbi:hypothetical protein JT358_13560 [Micrococcales bacterium 31B]|nr:hypothetical protein [Micrococcales bacterium 31B]